MSRPAKGRLPAIGDRLAESLDGQLADIAFSIGALDLDDSAAIQQRSADGRDVAPDAQEPGTDADAADEADASNAAGAAAEVASLDGVLDEFELAMGAMLDDRVRILTQPPAEGAWPDDDSAA